jgi:hypothetical protein
MLRAAAVERWLEAGIAGRDVCGGSLGPADFAPDVRFVPAGPRRIPKASPRPLRVRPLVAPKPGSLELSARQLRINQRISRAALRRANALVDRFSGGLTGADVRPRTIDAGRLVPGVAPAVDAGEVASTPSIRPGRVTARGTAGTVTLSVAQLRTNQRISSAALRRVNTVTRRIEAGLRGAEFRDGTLTAANLVPRSP